MEQRKEQTCDNGGAATTPETATDQADNPTRDVIALSASPCSCPPESGDAIGLDQTLYPVDSLICQAIQVLQKARLGVVYRRLKELGIDPAPLYAGSSPSII